MLSWPTLAVSSHAISPICDHGGPWGTPSQPQNGQKCTPHHQIFLFPPPTWLVVCPLSACPLKSLSGSDFLVRYIQFAMCPGVWRLRYGRKITRKSEACSQNGKKNVIIYDMADPCGSFREMGVNSLKNTRDSHLSLTVLRRIFPSSPQLCYNSKSLYTSTQAAFKRNSMI